VKSPQSWRNFWVILSFHVGFSRTLRYWKLQTLRVVLAPTGLFQWSGQLFQGLVADAQDAEWESERAMEKLAAVWNMAFMTFPSYWECHHPN
jgi:hypothetical protein